MYIKGTVNQCDISGVEYATPVVGAHALARGATGRVCCVLFVGPEYMEENNITLTSREEAEKWANDHLTGSVDF